MLKLFPLWGTLALCLVFFALVCKADSENEEQDMDEKAAHRRARFLSMFQVVEFPNTECAGNDEKNGTCYTANECETRGGKSIGTCASGYGVCCTFTLGCGDVSSENSTYFESADQNLGRFCTAKVCKNSEDICQLRLDFNSFSIAGPSTDTGLAAEVGGDIQFANKGVCVKDSFAAIGKMGSNPPMICGDNDGEHMYVNFPGDSDCVTLTFTFAADTKAEWSIRASQYACDYENLAPVGCTQYFFGESEGTIQSYNFEGGVHLGSQNQRACIRQEVGECKLCYYFSEATDFQVSMSDDLNKGDDQICCGYDEDEQSDVDCLIIPGLTYKDPDDDPSTVPISVDRFCGRSGTFGAIGDEETSATVCTKRVPYQLSFVTDALEGYEGEAEEMNAGFKINYFHSSEDC